eukprot:3485877-Pleurochrysis_carterae.AAC.1
MSSTHQGADGLIGLALPSEGACERLPRTQSYMNCTPSRWCARRCASSQPSILTGFSPSSPRLSRYSPASAVAATLGALLLRMDDSTNEAVAAVQLLLGVAVTAMAEVGLTDGKERAHSRAPEAAAATVGAAPPSEELGPLVVGRGAAALSEVRRKMAVRGCSAAG